MPADLDLLGAFTDAITGEEVRLPTPRGTLTVPRAEFEMAVRELAELRALQSGEDEGADYSRNVVEGLVDIINMAQEQQAGAVPLEMLEGLVYQEPDEPEPELDPAVEVVTGLLRSLGVDATAETGAQFLAILNHPNGHSVVPPAPGRHRAPEPEVLEQEPPPQLVQQRPAGPPVMLRPRAQAPAARLIPQHRQHSILPADGMPIRSVPTVDPNKNPVTAEQLFGLRRSTSGRYDAGSLDMEG